MTAERVSAISLDELEVQGVRAIILDLDNTTVGYGSDDIPPDIAAWVAEAKRRGFAFVLLSNNFNKRVLRVSEELGIPAIPRALKPSPSGFLKAARNLALPKGRIVVIGDQLFTDVLGAHLAGIRAILTHPLEPRDWAGTRILRFFERMLLNSRRLRLL